MIHRPHVIPRLLRRLVHHPLRRLHVATLDGGEVILVALHRLLILMQQARRLDERILKIRVPCFNPAALQRLVPRLLRKLQQGRLLRFLDLLTGGHRTHVALAQRVLRRLREVGPLTELACGTELAVEVLFVIPQDGLQLRIGDVDAARLQTLLCGADDIAHPLAVVRVLRRGVFVVENLDGFLRGLVEGGATIELALGHRIFPAVILVVLVPQELIESRKLLADFSGDARPVGLVRRAVGKILVDLGLDLRRQLLLERQLA